MTQERAEDDGYRQALPGLDGVEHIGAIIRRLIDDHECVDALATAARSNGHPTCLPRDRRHGNE